MFETIRLLIQCCTVAFIAFLVLLALPPSRLRDFLLPFVCWAVAALSVAYVIMPFDAMPEMLLGPFGLLDDLIALAVAISSGITAINAGKRLKQLPH